MEKPKVFIANPVPEEVENYLKEHCECVVWDFSKPKTFEGILENIKDADGVIQVGMKIDDNLLDNAPNLKVITNISVGYNNYDTDVMKKRNIIGTNTPGVLDNTVSDLVLGLMLTTARRIPELDKFTKSGSWVKADNSNLFGKGIHEKSLGIIGMGRIGGMVARKAKMGFDMEVSYHNRTRKLELEEKLGISYKSIDELLKTSDFVVIMTPLTDETFHMIGEEELKMMKDTAILVNASRGQVIDEKVLIKALKEGWIAGAGLDVYEVEPVEEDNPLLELENVVTLPHIGSATQKTRDDMAWAAARALVDELYGRNSGMRVPELA
ncbi:MAG: D-glycerate dehydrogenase [Gudongella sp.]|jgi:gluconate 2-dehydrogenase|nr:D-glycerate dehydrogenase [Gudongella sp.]